MQSFWSCEMKHSSEKGQNANASQKTVKTRFQNFMRHLYTCSQRGNWLPNDTQLTCSTLWRTVRDVRQEKWQEVCLTWKEPAQANSLLMLFLGAVKRLQ